MKDLPKKFSKALENAQTSIGKSLSDIGDRFRDEISKPRYPRNIQYKIRVLYVEGKFVATAYDQAGNNIASAVDEDSTTAIKAVDAIASQCGTYSADEIEQIRKAP